MTKTSDVLNKPLEFQVNNNSVLRAVKSCNRMLQKHRIIRTMKAGMYFEKPCDKRLRKDKESERRRRKSNSQQ